MAIISGGNVMPGNGLDYPLRKAGALASGDFAGQVALGGLAIDTTGAKLYICTATDGTSTATWVVVGTQA